MVKEYISTLWNDRVNFSIKRNIASDSFIALFFIAWLSLIVLFTGVSESIFQQFSAMLVMI